MWTFCHPSCQHLNSILCFIMSQNVNFLLNYTKLGHFCAQSSDLNICTNEHVASSVIPPEHKVEIVQYMQDQIWLCLYYQRRVAFSAWHRVCVWHMAISWWLSPLRYMWVRKHFTGCICMLTHPIEAFWGPKCRRNRPLPYQKVENDDTRLRSGG